MHPRALLRTVARTEAVTWALLLVGMVHGVVFIAYCLTVLAVAVDARWRASHAVLGLVCAVPPFATLWFERYAAGG